MNSITKFVTIFALAATVGMPTASFAHFDNDRDDDRDHGRGRCENGQVKVGAQYQGGIVAFVENADRKGCGEHGLIMAINDRPATRWATVFSGVSTSAARARGLYAGKGNTAVVMSKLNLDFSPTAIDGSALFTAQEDGTPNCPDLTQVCYGDWYLPSVYEMDILYDVFTSNGLGGFNATGDYWTSQDANLTDAFFFSFSTGVSGITTKTVFKLYHPVRKF